MSIVSAFIIRTVIIIMSNIIEAVPASCSLLFAKNIANNVIVTVNLSGTPQPRFSAAHPWQGLTSDTTGREVATRPKGFSGSSSQLIGYLTQDVTSGSKTMTLWKECKLDIGMYQEMEGSEGTVISLIVLKMSLPNVFKCVSSSVLLQTTLSASEGLHSTDRCVREFAVSIPS